MWWLLAAVGLAAASLPGPIASAATGDSTTVDSSGRTCVVALTPVPEGSSAVFTEPADYQCFDTFSEGISFATDGDLLLDSDAERVSEDDLESAGVVSTKVSPESSPILGIEYEHSDYGGDSLVLTGDGGSGCYAGVTYGFPSMSNLQFNNTISSAKSYSNCIGRHYSAPNYHDSKYDCVSGCRSVGKLNDRTSSIKFF